MDTVLVIFTWVEGWDEVGLGSFMRIELFRDSFVALLLFISGDSVPVLGKSDNRSLFDLAPRLTPALENFFGW